MGKQGFNIKELSFEVLSAYKKRRFSRSKQPNRTRFEETDTELDIVRCYLSGLTIKEAVKFLEMERSVYVSKSAVGRFYRDLFLNKVYPVKRRFIER